MNGEQFGLLVEAVAARTKALIAQNKAEDLVAALSVLGMEKLVVLSSTYLCRNDDVHRRSEKCVCHNLAMEEHFAACLEKF